MSFILDALKKSETERQRQALPGFVESGMARPPARLPTWAIGIGALLLVNLLVLVLLYLHRPATAPPLGAAAARAHQDAGRDASPVARAVAPHFSPMDSAPPVYAPEITPDNPATSGSEPDVAEIPRRSAGTRAPLADSPPAPRAMRQRDPVLTEDYKPEDDEVLPTINELNLTGAQALPELHLDVHVFATQPSERFVYVNMHKYHEKATLQEGPTVERIRRDGVVLSYNGVRFLLPRQ